jgi:hypothetical protein
LYRERGSRSPFAEGALGRGREDSAVDQLDDERAVDAGALGERGGRVCRQRLCALVGHVLKTTGSIIIAGRSDPTRS